MNWLFVGYIAGDTFTHKGNAHLADINGNVLCGTKNRFGMDCSSEIRLNSIGLAVAENLEETVKALKNLIFTASKLWDDTKPIQDTKIMTFTHPIIEEAKELLTKIQSK